MEIIGGEACAFWNRASGQVDAMSRSFQIFEQILRPSPFELVIGGALHLPTRPALICQSANAHLSSFDGGVMHTSISPPFPQAQ